MLALALALSLGLSPSMAGPPAVAVHGATTIDATNSIFVTAPTLAEQCTNGSYTTVQGGAISVTRASLAACETENGSISYIDNNKLVVEDDGIRVEPASSNRVTYSEGISTNWTLTDLTVGSTIADPFGGNAAEELDTTSAGGLATSPSFTITGTSAVLSAWTHNAGANTATLILRDTTAGADRCTISITASSTVFGTMAARPSCNSAAIVSGNTHVVRFYPAGAAGEGGGAAVIGVQVEPGTIAKTSYIPTTGTAASRAADAITTTITDNSTAGCLGATMRASAPAFPQRLFTKGATTAGINSTTQIYSNDGTNSVYTGGGLSDITGRSVPFRVQWSGGTLSLSADSGAATGTGSFDGSMGTGTTLYIGSNSGVQQFHGWLKAIKTSTSALGCTP